LLPATVFIRPRPRLQAGLSALRPARLGGIGQRRRAGQSGAVRGTSRPRRFEAIALFVECV